MKSSARKLFLAALSGLLFTTSLPLAAAHVGTGIGVAFPMGGTTVGSTTESRPETYAAFSHDGIIEELTATEKSGRLLLKYKITNNTDQPYSVSHPDGQNYDLVLLDKNGAALWKWSDGMAFTQALQTSSIAAHASEVYKAEIERKDYKKIKDDAVLCAAYLKDTPYQVLTRVPRTTRASSGSSTGAIIGSIVIGNGHWYDD